jgi:flavin-dependent dehydrogenase
MFSNYTVLILGGGPAGCAAALTLARAGIRVAVVERSSYDGLRFGETLPPSIQPLMRRLGIWQAFVRDGHLPAPAIVSSWADPEPYDNDFIRNPYGNGWHLDRALFDRNLADAAQRAGATMFRSTRVRSVARKSTQGWQIQCECDGSKQTLATDILIDGTGRSAWLARLQGARRIIHDRLVGVIGFGLGLAVEDRRTIIEATPDGWWYSARLPQQKVVAAFMTDADLLPRGHKAIRRYWLNQIQAAPMTGALCAEPIGDLQVKVAGTVRLDRASGPGWLAIGDAAVAYDPLSSQGIYMAMESGWRGALAITASLQGNATAATEYAEWLAVAFAEYCQNYFHHYGRVTRWPDAVFWTRRRNAADMHSLGNHFRNVNGYR